MTTTELQSSALSAISPLDEESLKLWLKSAISPERYLHSLGAQKKSVELAQHFQLPPDALERCRIAGLLHDSAKHLKPAELIDACQRYDIILSDADRLSLQTLHPIVGAEWVKRELEITDEIILNAIRFHTTGRAGMTSVEKIVYIADKIEENTRNPLYTSKIMDLIRDRKPQTLDKVVLYILDSTMTFLIEKGQAIHPRTLEARNDILRQIKDAQSIPTL